MISVSQATKRNKNQLKEFFKHYKLETLIENKSNNFVGTTVAIDGDKLVGVIQWSIKKDPSLGVVEIEEISVLMAYQKQGLGSKIMDFAIKSIKDHFQENNLKLRKIYTFVYESNLAAQKFYEKFEFKKESKVNKLFSLSDDSLIYVLTLE